MRTIRFLIGLEDLIVLRGFVSAIGVGARGLDGRIYQLAGLDTYLGFFNL